MTDLILERLEVSVGGKTRLHPFSTSIRPGQIVALVGPNGAGKSTLLRAIAALVAARGQAIYGGQTIAALPPSLRARTVGFLPQSHVAGWSMPVRDMVALGQYAFGTARPPAEIARAVDEMLAACGIAELADRPIDRLSGGEQALAALARVLLTDSPILLLDEPVAALDIGRQYQLLEQLAVLAASGRTILVALHDLTLVSQFAGRILWMDAGRIVADTPNDRAAISTQAAILFGRAVVWSDAAAEHPATAFFARDQTLDRD
ncbi:MAG: ABC transporter ATP-binding protein [Sphingopyxis sp.]|nr:ABC transporter ATP-binding protein [Sphingopyxis sp.]